VTNPDARALIFQQQSSQVRYIEPTLTNEQCLELFNLDPRTYDPLAQTA
jgi:hypothetical protein